MSNEQMMAEIARLKAENERLQAAKAKADAKRISLKVSEKGGLSVYGLGRFPVTLYREQWEKLLGLSKEIAAFIKANDGKLKAKEA